MKISDLHRLFLSCNAVCTDTRLVKSQDLFFALTGDNFNGNTFAAQALKNGAKYAIIDDAAYHIEGKTYVVENVLETLQELAAYHRTYLNIPIIALTGSNGKTTSKELINTVLSKSYNTTATVGNLNNHIGVPLTLLSMNKDTEIGIVEMGANHLKEIEFLCSLAQPNFGYITNFGKAHLEGFGSLEGVVQGKSELYQYIRTTDGTAFINANDAKQVSLTSDLKTISFGDATTQPDTKIELVEANPFVIGLYEGIHIQSQLIGTYNFTNISAAIAIGNYFKVEHTAIKDAIENYTPTNNRSQIIHKNGSKIILDAYNANPSSMKVALESFHIIKDSPKIAILGDMFELGKDAPEEHQAIVDLASELNIDKVFVIGRLFHDTKPTSDKIASFDSYDTFRAFFTEVDTNQTTLLIKASRGMKLERILDLI